MSPTPRTREAGFTLLEVLIALAIFALVAAAGYLALRQGMSTDEHLRETRNFWQGLGSAFSLMRRDLNQARDLPPRIPGRAKALAFQGSNTGAGQGKGTLFHFTRGGHASFRDGPVSPFRRVAYRFRKGNLVRATWSRLNAPLSLEPRKATVLKGVSKVEVRYLGSRNRNWQRRWPPGSVQGQGPGLPRAVEITLEFESHGRFKRIFHVGPPQ
ncbi:MAG TPA: type II secretion system minor pseudopilin GspJ [Gammaproteobacteria bacterium]|nr:type II secretion system minor pseudopilin GspJ [Gammaproteobacteria bacterium]